MLWVVSAAETDQEQSEDRDISSRTLNTILGRQTSTTEEADTENSKKSEGDAEPFNLCPDPTCKNHIVEVGDIIFWKMKNISSKEYSEKEINDAADRKRRQAIRDYQTISKIVDGLVESTDYDAESGESIDNGQSQTEKETPPQQLDRCKCGEQQKPTQTSVGTTTTEGESVKDRNRSKKSFKVAVSALPFVNVDVGGGTEDGTKTTTKETESIKTMDTATFPICPDLSCEEHLQMLGRIECWKRRNDYSHEYTNEEIEEEVMEALEQEIRGDQILSENADEVFEELIKDSQDPSQKKATGTAMTEEMAAFAGAFDTETDSHVVLAGIKKRKLETTNSPSPSDGTISARLAGRHPSTGEETTNSEGASNDNDEKKGPGGTSL
ncbi:hypothetical protein EIK79_05855 [Halocatena pleomorpha]|uniref:Uncharacterized protein n=2 Tax=Halocatena pleomorpha TaxID=1785090 RepID=A0A3P3RF69_9EURY|nr:hypothetical protein EIK79_05855 [Halocatena pleomorpha]